MIQVQPLMDDGFVAAVAHQFQWLQPRSSFGGVIPLAGLGNPMTTRPEAGESLTLRGWWQARKVPAGHAPRFVAKQLFFQGLGHFRCPRSPGTRPTSLQKTARIVCIAGAKLGLLEVGGAQLFPQSSSRGPGPWPLPSAILVGTAAPRPAPVH